MSGVRILLALLFTLAAIFVAFIALTVTPQFFSASADYGLHHEATVPLCRFIALVALSLGLALSGAQLGGSADLVTSLRPFGAMLAVAIIAFGAELMFANEIFYSLFDPKGFPVHPTEQVIFPEAGWHGMASHLISSLLLFVGFGFVWLGLRPRRRRQEKESDPVT